MEGQLEIKGFGLLVLELGQHKYVSSQNRSKASPSSLDVLYSDICDLLIMMRHQCIEDIS